MIRCHTAPSHSYTGLLGIPGENEGGRKAGREERRHGGGRKKEGKEVGEERRRGEGERWKGER